MIEPVQIDIGEELTGEVADRDTAPALQGSEQVIARKIQVDRFLGIGRINDAVNEVQGLVAGDPPADVVLEDLVVDRRKISQRST